MKNGDKPACPVDTFAQDSIGIEIKHSIGLTKREMFAMAAMQGLCANSIPGSQHRPEHLIFEALEYADELLKQLESKS